MTTIKRTSVVCRAGWDHGGRSTCIGRGYGIYRDGQLASGVHYSPSSAWADYRRRQAASAATVKQHDGAPAAQVQRDTTRDGA